MVLGVGLEVMMQTKTLSITMWAGQADLIKRASDKAGVSVSEFVRAHVIPAAAEDLNVAPPNFPAFEPPHFRRGSISIAAESLGLTTEQFKQRMAEQAAKAVIDELGGMAVARKSERPPTQSSRTSGARRTGT